MLSVSTTAAVLLANGNRVLSWIASALFIAIVAVFASRYVRGAVQRRNVSRELERSRRQPPTGPRSS